ncbi:MAG: hypothetical protein WAL50_14755 [Kineosporiaceae bacterium]
MEFLIATAHLAGLRLRDRARTHARAHTDQGSVTVEQVVITLMLAGLVVAVGAALKSYISAKLAGLN